MRKRRVIRWIVVLAGIILLGSESFSLALRWGRVHDYLVERLESAVGRPVEVGHFSFSALDGFRVQASPITVGEDARFGYEYFLRADQLTAGLRWRSLLRGHFEFGTLSFSHPSLNLVRTPDGHWNLESWLPPPNSAAPLNAGASKPAASLIPPGRLYKIEVDAGRLNLKTGADKSPFALVDVKGLLEQEAPGRWRVDLEAHPAHSTVALQESGIIRVQGRIAGTSARLQPAELNLSWQQASMADVLRLARGRDYGVRGSLSLELDAKIAPASAAGTFEKVPAPAGVAHWQLQGALRLAGIHRWDLAQRADNPSINLFTDFEWQRGSGGIELTRCVLEAPHSSVRGLGTVQWIPSLVPEIHLLTSGIDFRDLLSWYRAFRPGVAEDLNLDGLLGFDLTMKGWPLEFERGIVESPGGTLRLARLTEPVRLGALAGQVKHGRLELQPITISLGPARGRAGSSIRFQGSLGVLAAEGRVKRVTPENSAWPFELAAEGTIARVQDILDAARALGRVGNPGWSAEGQANLDVRLRGTLRPFAVETLGEMDLHSLRVEAPYLNQPVLLNEAKVEWKSGARLVTLASARAFGTQWKGELQKTGDAPWTFDLSADRLDLAEVDRWLNPLVRTPQLERLFPLLAAARPSAGWENVLASLRGAGKIQVGELALGAFRANSVRGVLSIDGRTIQFTAYEAQFYKGRLTGEVRANLDYRPLHDIKLKFDRVDLESLAAATPTLEDKFGGIARGELELRMQGATRAELVDTLAGQGLIDVRSGQYRGLDLDSSYAAGEARPGLSRFAGARIEFHVGRQSIQMDRARLASAADDLRAQGSVDFARTLNLQIWREGGAGARSRSAADSPRLSLTGTLAEPQIGPAPARVKMR